MVYLPPINLTNYSTIEMEDRDGDEGKGGGLGVNMGRGCMCARYAPYALVQQTPLERNHDCSAQPFCIDE